MSDRSYLPARYPGYAERIPCLADVGNTLKFSGAVLQGMGATVILLTPSGEVCSGSRNLIATVHGQKGEYSFAYPTLEQWGEIIRASDDPQVWVKDGNAKILHRKLLHEISGFTQQRIWHRDGFKCVYCQAGLPQVQLSVDHVHPLISGGATDASNLVTACKKCNKRKGDISLVAFCREHGFYYERINAYVETLK